MTHAILFFFSFLYTCSCCAVGINHRPKLQEEGRACSETHVEVLHESELEGAKRLASCARAHCAFYFFGFN